MSDMGQLPEKYFHPGTVRAVLSDPVSNREGVSKIVISRVQDFLQAERFEGRQAFHENLTDEQAGDLIARSLGKDFRQYNAWDEAFQYSVRITAKGKWLYRKKELRQAPSAKKEHNRTKKYLLPEGSVVAPLVDMGVFTPDGRIVKAMYDKYRQINRFIEIIDDELENWPPDKLLNIVDFGCGKSYLTFILYYYLTELKKLKVAMTGLDLKADVIKSCSATARKYGYDNLIFALGDISGYQSPVPVDMVICLHACDTATDYALYNAVRWNARYIFAVPCCQHEFNRQMKSERLSLLTRYGIIQERMAALMTDAIRADLLTCCGYKTQVLEFVDLSHTPKNLLIRAVKASLPQAVRDRALNEVNALTGEFGLSPTLQRLLAESP